ncbi:MAG TPA: hypothetical protein VGL56_09085 [Fimbriimonadaceae bacterium]
MADVLIVCILVLMNAWIAYQLWGVLSDDFAITFRVSYNFSIGRGLVYNPGSHYQSTSAPGYAFLLGVIGWMFGKGSITIAADLLSAVALFAIGIGTYVLGRKRHWFLGAILAISVTAIPLVWWAYDNEFLPQLALVVWGYVLMERRPTAAAVLFAFAVVVRPDAALALAPALGLYIWRYRKFPVMPAIAFLCVILPCAFLVWRQYGHFLPDTMGAKAARLLAIQRHDKRGTTFFGHQVLQWMEGYIPLPDPELWLYLAVLGAVVLLIRLRITSLVALASWIALYYAFYAGYYKVYETWYYAPVGLGLAMMVSCIFFELCRWAATPKKYARIAASTALAIVAVLIADQLYAYFHSMVSTAFILNASTGLSFLVLGILAFGVLAFFCWLSVKYLLPWTGGEKGKFSAPVASAPGIVAACFALDLMAGFLDGDLRMAGSRATLVRTTLYTEAGKWLDLHVRPGVTVGYTEIGFIGWNAPNVVIMDPLGLGSPAPREFIQRAMKWPVRTQR